MALWVIAQLTFREAARRKILLAAVVLGALFLVVYGIGLGFIAQKESEDPMPSIMVRNEIYNFLSMAGLYVVNFLLVMMSALTSADTLSGEIASGAMHSVACKPIRRWQIVMGKWLGFAAMLGLYTLLMAGGVMLLMQAIGHYRVLGFERGILLLWLNGLLILTISLAGGTALSTLANGVLVFGLFGVAFAGGWIEQIGAFLENPEAVNVGIVSSLIMPSEALWRRAAFEMRSPLVSAFGFSPFSSQSVPSEAMVLYALLYLAAGLAFAVWWFEKRDL